MCVIESLQTLENYIQQETWAKHIEYDWEKKQTKTQKHDEQTRRGG